MRKGDGEREGGERGGEGEGGIVFDGTATYKSYLHSRGSGDDALPPSFLVRYIAAALLIILR